MTKTHGDEWGPSFLNNRDNAKAEPLFSALFIPPSVIKLLQKLEN